MDYALLYLAVVLVIFFIRRRFSYCERKGVPAPKAWSFFGNVLQSFTQKKTVGQIFREIYHTYDTLPLVGAYRTNEPVLIVRDPELISQILVKDSHVFFNNDFSVDPKLDPMQGASPFVQKDQQWRTTRTMLSPGFTSGKMKRLFPLIVKVNQRLSKYLESQPNIELGHTVETQILCRRFTLDNVALAAFGIDGKCFESEESDFMRLANSFIAPGSFALSMLQMFPLISHLVSLKVIPEAVEGRLTQIITDSLEYRKKNKVIANDYLQFIAQLGDKVGFNFAEISGHAATFFEDGYETSALVMSYLLFNLSRHQEVQDRLRAEIAQFEQQNEIDYDHLAKMPYLNACIYESMRACPVLDHYTRVCSRPYIYKTPNESPKHLQRMDVNIDAETVCLIPFGGLCHDPVYFPHPEAFIPERFLDKDSQGFKRVFYPFGGGHRICLGQRFGIMQVKMGIVEIIKKFQVTFDEKTHFPFEFLPWTVLNKVKQGVWLTYRKL
nr:cytochrome P450 CYP347D1 [Dendroctonus rhizophagus]